jgi:hypothetical protein
MSFEQMRQAVYWLPDMDKWEYGHGQYAGFTHKWAHRLCWDALKEKRREYIRLFSFKNQEPRSLGQVV